MNRFSIGLACLIVAFLAAGICPATASAQSIVGGSTSDPTGKRPELTQIGFFELLESASDAILSALETKPEPPTVENPQWDSLASPRATILTFREAMALLVTMGFAVGTTKLSLHPALSKSTLEDPRDGDRDRGRDVVDFIARVGDPRCSTIVQRKR